MRPNTETLTHVCGNCGVETQPNASVSTEAPTAQAWIEDQLRDGRPRRTRHLQRSCPRSVGREFRQAIDQLVRQGRITVTRHQRRVYIELCRAGG